MFLNFTNIQNKPRNYSGLYCGFYFNHPLLEKIKRMCYNDSKLPIDELHISILSATKHLTVDFHEQLGLNIKIKIKGLKVLKSHEFDFLVVEIESSEIDSLYNELIQKFKLTDKDILYFENRVVHITLGMFKKNEINFEKYKKIKFDESIFYLNGILKFDNLQF